jgi:hypothetical protein
MITDKGRIFLSNILTILYMSHLYLCTLQNKNLVQTVAGKKANKALSRKRSKEAGRRKWSSPSPTSRGYTD